MTPVLQATIRPRQLQDADGELHSLEGRPLDRVAEAFQHVGFNLAGDLSVDGWGGAGELAKPGQQHAGQPDRPTCAMLGGEADQLLEDGSLEVLGRCWVPEQDP
jgi:hypothetical protein